MNNDENRHYQAYIEAMELILASIAVVEYNTNTRTVEGLLAQAMDRLRAMRNEYDDLDIRSSPVV